MSDALPPTGPIWLTYHQVAERLGIRTAQAAKARARRGKWPKRIRNDTGEAEVAVPPELLAADPQKPQERRRQPEPPLDAGTIADAVRGAVAPLEGIIDTLVTDVKVARATNDALRDQLAAALAEAGELRGKSAANEAALEREVQDRRALQQQADRVRHELRATEERAAKAQMQVHDGQRRNEHLEQEVARLKRELGVAEAAQKKRRWWRLS